MADAVGLALTLAVGAALVAGLWRQLVPLGRRGIVADQFGLLPQWRFFAQASVARTDRFDDLHLVVRIAAAGGAAGAWRPVFDHGERRWLAALWNPALRPDGVIGEAIEDLVSAGAAAAEARFQSSRLYLTLLRASLDRTPLHAGEALQFAVVATRGRGERALAVRYLSAWHGG